MALALDPDDVASLLVRADTLLRLAENDSTRKKALVDLRRAAQLEPNDPTCWVLIAETSRHLKLGRCDAALRVRLLLPFGATKEMKISRDEMQRIELDSRAVPAVSSQASDAAHGCSRLAAWRTWPAPMTLQARGPHLKCCANSPRRRTWEQTMRPTWLPSRADWRSICSLTAMHRTH